MAKEMATSIRLSPEAWQHLDYLSPYLPRGKNTPYAGIAKIYEYGLLKKYQTITDKIIAIKKNNICKKSGIFLIKELRAFGYHH